MQLRVSPATTGALALPDLIAFLRVIDHRSFSKAAEVLGETKGTVSRRVARLEAALGVRLLQRTPRSMSVTEAGAYFRDAAREALAIFESVTNRLSNSQAEPEGILRLTAPHDLVQHLVPRLVKSFMVDNPRVRIEVVASDEFLDLASHRLDLAIRATDTLADSGYVAHRLLGTEIGLFAAPAYLAEAGVPSRGVGRLGETHRLIMRASDFKGDGVHLRRIGGGEELLIGRPAFLASSFMAAMGAAEEGLGIAYLPTLTVERAVAERRLVRVFPRWSCTPAHLFLIHARGPLPARVRAFRDYVRATLVKLDPGRR